MIRFVLTITLALGFVNAFGQKMMTREGYIRFFGTTPAEDIEGVSNQAQSVIDVSTGDMAWQVLMTTFSFEKALMQEHFNENYVESESYPKASFAGRIENIGDLDFDTDGEYDVTLAGKLTIHGVTKDVTANGTITIKDGEALLDVTFDAAPEDYNIEIPSVVRDKIAREFDVTVKAKYQPLER